MGLFSFLKRSGKKVKKGNEDAEILQAVLTALSKEVVAGHIVGLQVHFADGTATLTGTVDTQANRQKAILIAGNIDGVEQVNDDALVVKEEEAAEPAFTFYTIQSGDSLSKIAKRTYGDAMRWEELFEANREVIQDPNLIYPGQQIRVPAGA